jgi:hypothetical protein
LSEQYALVSGFKRVLFIKFVMSISPLSSVTISEQALPRFKMVFSVLTTARSIIGAQLRPPRVLIEQPTTHIRLPALAST